MKCKYCEAETADDSLFCEHCGKNLVRTKKIDIRWCLLLAMELVLLCRNYYYIDAYRFISLGILFLITLYYGIKKTIRPSFLIFSGVFFLIEITTTLSIILLQEVELNYKLYSVVEFFSYNQVYLHILIVVLYLLYAFIAYKKKIRF